jgi:hypothetical protein
MPNKLRTALGVLLIVVGLISVPVPILPGCPLVAAGAALLGCQHKLIRPWRMWLLRRGFLKEENGQG